ncbi:MAG: phosphoribosylformylglycinamidine synthase subunit PurQ [Nitrospinaceae bacterium]|jgi:phosphoribosylformylglycinamidine synthase|nr:phosphoribosylformylglycinamidine synthase subunit PurQ [Nitrospinaceae bacterium]MDP6657206.1 phosphoribosylformylglycinamidine synthase subunit PurQ [Nitrospinaceae bacterium]MDP6711213.1 phosphoribosylformylglycinamidine synthase subunit PurQ [Nitrospinaceae bacterium]MDP7057081.1 phosphoribosylformylglycinamidine synthase subunit PurQ [Nitrospinaceae bacterium]HAK37853.1 phosphoribosylformylglycinamidine synthase I [Nitrospina sp.]|tara:strand:- start:1194 stop:1901 length:708 start_codon:yes stop_codon:yes gene_type:complete
MNCGVVVFPGSNCDHDCFHILKHVFKLHTEWIWHKGDMDLSRFDLIVLPGGFSYGDYLRAGAIAQFSTVMKDVIRFAESGGRVLGICNGFQVLVEAKLLPGALIQNNTQKFICKTVPVRVENTSTAFTGECAGESVLNIPIAHHQGSYFIDPDGLRQLEENRQVVFRYCGPSGEVTDEFNPNGSVGNIAGIINEAGNVMGLMPHPERCADPAWPNLDGQLIFKSIIKSLQSGVSA